MADANPSVAEVRDATDRLGMRPPTANAVVDGRYRQARATRPLRQGERLSINSDQATAANMANLVRLAGRNGQGLFGGPASGYPCLNDGGGESSSLTPLGDSKRDTHMGKKMTGASVLILFLFSSPSAIAGAVRPVVVLSFDSVRPARLSSHVTQEVLERITPPLADTNAPPSIVSIPRVVLVETSSAHVLPRVVFRRGFFVNDVAMRLIGLRCESPMLTAAARIGPSLQVATSSDTSATANAQAPPSLQAEGRFLGTLNYSKEPELAA